MATASRHFCRSLTHLSRSSISTSRSSASPQIAAPPFKQECSPLFTQGQHIHAASRRHFSRNASRAADDNNSRKSANSLVEDAGAGFEPIDPNEFMTPAKPYTAADLLPEERADYDRLSQEQKEQYLAYQNHFKAMLEGPEGQKELDRMVSEADIKVKRNTAELDFREVRNQLAINRGWWGEDEDDEFGQIEDDDDASSDEHITSVAESELEVHREVREYTRIAAWDLPLLSQYARPYQPPAESSPLRFRYTTYMGESHPAASKVVCEFLTTDVARTASLSETQRSKLIKLVGVRYNPDTDIVKMSSEKFEHAAQNKRYLGELVAKIVSEAKNTEDTFEDIPLDLRHHKPRRQPVFPEQWKLTNSRTLRALAEQRRLSGGGSGNGEKLLQLQGRDEVVDYEREPELVDGKRLVEVFVREKMFGGAQQRPRVR